MLPFRSRPCRHKSAGAVAALLLALGASTALAQQATGMRGGLTAGLPGAESPLERDARRRDPLNVQRPEPLAPETTATYRPVSLGAVPDTTADPRIEQLLDGTRAPASTQAQDDQQRRADRRARETAAAQPRTTRTNGRADGGANGETTDDATTGSVARQAGAGLLPALDDTPLPPNAATRGIDAGDLERNVAQRADAERIGAVETRGGAADPSPFAAPGIRAGSFILRPTLDQGIEWSSNAAAAASGNSDLLSSTTARLGVASEWSRHALNLDISGTWRKSLRGTGFSELSGSANAGLRLDLAEGFVSNTTIGYQRQPETPSLAVDTVGRSLRETMSASTGLEKTIGPALLAARVSADRNVYGMATLAAGGVASQADRNNTLYGLTLRGGYEVSPAMRPFLEAELGRRLYDNRLDAAGLARSATRYGARAGLTFDLGEKFNGEVAGGWLTERPDDASLAAISAATIDATLGWSPIRGTQIDLGLSTNVESSSVAGSSGALVYGARLGATHELGARLTASALLSAELRRYAGTAMQDTTLGASASLTWWLNRYAGITGRAGHERLQSTDPARSYGSTNVYLGVTLQR